MTARKRLVGLCRLAAEGVKRQVSGAGFPGNRCEKSHVFHVEQRPAKPPRVSHRAPQRGGVERGSGRAIRLPAAAVFGTALFGAGTSTCRAEVLPPLSGNATGPPCGRTTPRVWRLTFWRAVDDAGCDEELDLLQRALNGRTPFRSCQVMFGAAETSKFAGRSPSRSTWNMPASPWESVRVGRGRKR